MGNPELQARETIDALLVKAGWMVSDTTSANISAHRGVAIREFPLPGHGFADYLLYIDGKASGFIEAQNGQRNLERREGIFRLIHQGSNRRSSLLVKLPVFSYHLTG